MSLLHGPKIGQTKVRIERSVRTQDYEDYNSPVPIESRTLQSSMVVLEESATERKASLSVASLLTANCYCIQFLVSYLNNYDYDSYLETLMTINEFLSYCRFLQRPPNDCQRLLEGISNISLPFLDYIMY